ncbi:MAG TPA: MurR/RpiR family transcriptional regulator [bacterium]|nr:MurR/RpiR family transcriptional regulator [Dictyoglomota bacterium]HRR91186.1 MurR/RpiR family transcriptional regulator [bacterium]
MQESVTCLGLIRSHYPSLTPAEQRVADFILNDPGKVIYMSVTELAEKCDVGDGTVVRFAHDIGLSGYQELKLILSRDLSNSFEYVLEDVSPEDSLEDIVRKITNRNLRAIADTTQLISIDSLNRAIEAIYKARRVEFYGVGASGFTALEAKYKFLRIGILCDALTDPHLQAMSASTLNSRDVAIGVSHSGATKDTVDSIKVAKNAGATTICITNFARSPITEFTDIVLLTASPEAPLASGAIRSIVSQLHVLDLLFTGVAMRLGEQALRYTEMTAQAVLNKLY